jgi:DNA-binding response OmpR family regulator
MGKFMRLVARALVGVAALVCAAGAQAVTLPPHFQETVAIDGLDNPTAVRFAADGRDASEEERSWGTKSRRRRRQRSSRRTITRLLTRIGCQAEEAQTGREALETADRIRPRLVLAEVNLPEVSGYEVCHELRHRYGDDVAVIFLSADRTEPYDRVGGLLLGAVDYIVKPFDEGELLARVRGGLNQVEIAAQLMISPKTVGTHIQRVLTKLSVHSRAQAVAFAHAGLNETEAHLLSVVGLDAA